MDCVLLGLGLFGVGLAEGWGSVIGRVFSDSGVVHAGDSAGSAIFLDISENRKIGEQSFL